MGLIRFECISLLMTVMCLIFLSGNILEASAGKIGPKTVVAVENGRFAVSEFNKRQHTSLLFLNVVDGSFETTGGKVHIHLTLKAINGNVAHKYNAHLIHYPNKTKELHAFVLLA
ncbi:hypothetical protein ABFX02_01G077600 [Erythranthe guttata]